MQPPENCDIPPREKKFLYKPVHENNKRIYVIKLIVKQSGINQALILIKQLENFSHHNKSMLYTFI